MKKILVALMAVLVMVSCGGKKEDAAAKDAKKTNAGELAAELTPIIRTAIDELNQGITPSAVMEKMVSEEAGVLAKYSDEATKVFDNLGESEFKEAYPNQGPAYFDAKSEFVDKLYNIEDRLDSDEKQKMWDNRHKAKVI